ncbi:MAG: SDR family oxidoreductase [Pseudomonadota bacterium]|jgi:NAD(P)-dependent dehydrogenase (short-subunit alcohol dehydrogenase family)|nr:SDR family oxidoreductase [Pseudomonadota bacterium]
MNSLHGKVAAVLGASAEAGTGWAIAEALASAGAKVVVAARSEAPLKKLAAKIDGAYTVCDAGNEVQIEAFLQTAVDRFGELDIAVNAAGLPVLGLIGDSDSNRLQAAIDVNYLANVHFVKHAAERIGMDGSIVIVSSLSTTHPIVPNFAYACAKAASDCLVRYAALEYGPRNIRINSIQPGAIVSDLSRELFSSSEVTKLFEKEVPLGRLGCPSDFANAVLWLAGPAYVTGLNLPVCGGAQLTRFPYLSEMPGAGSAWEGTGQNLFDRERADRATKGLKSG